MTIANQEYYSILDQICSTSPDARHWIAQLLEAASTWDHIIDNDEIDVEQSDRTFRALLTEWPLNPFFMKYATSLLPVMVGAISAWKFSNLDSSPKILAYQFYTEIPTTVAFILGGNDLVARYIPRLRQVVLKMHDEDEARDGGKK